MTALASQLKRHLVTVFGWRNVFSRQVMGIPLRVGYSLRKLEPERDYAVIRQLAKGRQCMLDVGANLGIISLLLSADNPEAKVHAFDASEEAVRLINWHAEINGFGERIRVINALVTERSGYVLPFYGEAASGGASLVPGRLGHVSYSYKATLSLDDYVQSEGLAPDFVKMDIEGAEGMAILGMRGLLKKYAPLVVLELHPFGKKSLVDNATGILELARTLDYEMIYLRTGEPLITAEPLQGRGRCHVLLISKAAYNPSMIKSLDLHGL